MSGVGRPTEMGDELKLTMRDWILEDRTLEEIAVLSDIPVATIIHWQWRNYKGFGDALRGWRHERMLAKAEQNIGEILAIPQTDNEGMLRIKSDMTKFVAETLGRKNYARKTETDVTSGGKPISSINYLLPDGIDAPTDNQATPSVPTT